MKISNYSLRMIVCLLIISKAACAITQEDAFRGEAYWISPTGTATWANARSETPLSGTAAASLATANANASAGDTIILRGGTYNTPIQPARSGAGIDARITYRAHSGETPVVSQAGDMNTNFIAINFDGRSYIKIYGIKIEHVGRWALFTRGSSYNEISHCEFAPPTLIGFNIYRGNSGAGAPCTHNWIHHNILHESGRVSDAWDDQGHVMQVGEQTYDSASNNNTIEDNIFYRGGHHLLETFSQFNVIRDNHMHNESWMDPPTNPTRPPVQQPASNGKYGNRCFTLDAQYGGPSATDGAYNLAEGNRFGHAGRPPDDDGADNVELASPRNIFRHNYIFNAAKDGLYFRDGAHGSVFGDHNRVYNNTVYYNGHNEAYGYDSNYRRSGILYRIQCTGNVIKNNISYGNYNRDIYCFWPIELHGNTVENNWLTSAEKNNPIFVTPGLVGNPLFVNPDISNPMSTTLPDLRLRNGSPAIDRGTHLTHAVQAGNNSITLLVEDALYFQDGSWGSSLSDVRADWIAIGTVSNMVQIKSINYATNTITLAEPATWSAQARVWLFADSKGRRVLHGKAPDIGAYEYRNSIIPR